MDPNQPNNAGQQPFYLNSFPWGVQQPMYPAGMTYAANTAGGF
jgi:hypothetical protein